MTLCTGHAFFNDLQSFLIKESNFLKNHVAKYGFELVFGLIFQKKFAFSRFSLNNSTKKLLDFVFAQDLYSFVQVFALVGVYLNMEHFVTVFRSLFFFYY